MRFRPSLLLAGIFMLMGCAHGTADKASAPPVTELAIASPKASPPATPKPEWKGAEYVKFDGFQLGSIYSEAVLPRTPYNEPCDDDPIDHRKRRFMVYGALPCRDKTFPEGTTVAFYLHYAEGKRELSQAIEAFAFMGGNYFASRSDFPLRVGDPAEKADEVLGAASETLSLGRLAVKRHPGFVYSLVEGGELVGFVIGPMPGDAENEQWRGLLQMYERYTRPKGR